MSGNGSKSSVDAACVERRKLLDRVRRRLSRRKIDGFLVTDRCNVRYLSGFTGSSGALFITVEGPLFLLTDSRYAEQAGKECPGFCRESGKGGLPETLKRIFSSGWIETAAFEPESVSYGLYARLETVLPGARFLPLKNFVRGMRAVKTDEEILKIRAACAAADRALEHLKSRVRPGVSEIELEAELLYYLRTEESAGISFPPVISSGERTSLPHARPSTRKIRQGDLLMLDFGAEIDGYCSDLTRTFSVGRMAGDKKRLYKTVLKNQSRCVEILEPGAAAGKVFGFSRRLLREEGCELVHGLGHGLGLEIHELPRVSSGSRQILRENMVFTVEPGVYLEGRFGVRIEDVVLLSGGWAETISRAPKSLKENII